MVAQVSDVRHVDEGRLEKDVTARFAYLSEFMGFGPADIEAIHAAAKFLAPLVPGLVDAVYDKLFQYDATKRHFLPRQAGFTGPVPSDMHAITHDNEQIRFRKGHLGAYLTRLVTAPYDGKLVSYLDFVGAMHTSRAGNPDILVPLVQMDALMGFVSDALLNAILNTDVDAATKAGTIRAFNKLLWLQNDLIVRHYAA